ncbi:MAG: hypothetical protein Q9160_003365 [Pyrenula sp. 1 TL-2023]
MGQSNTTPIKPFRFLDLPPKIRFRIYRLLFRQTPCDRHESSQMPEYQNGTTEYLYDAQDGSLVKQVVALPDNVIHVDRISNGLDKDLVLGMASCCRIGSVLGTLHESISLLLTNKQIAAEASNVLYQENVFDFIREVEEVNTWFGEEDLDDDSLALGISLRNMATKRLGNVTNLRLRSSFCFCEGRDQMVWAIEGFLKAAGHVCAGHHFLKRMTISFKKQPEVKPLVGESYYSWMTVELSELTKEIETAMRLSNDNGTIRDKEIESHAQAITRMIVKVKSANDSVKFIEDLIGDLIGESYTFIIA